jgi:DNA-binding NarL/FixJ family response regulator
VVIIAGEDSDDVRITCLAQGADGFVSKRHYRRDLPHGVSRLLDKPPLCTPQMS